VIFLALVALIIFFSLKSPFFFSPDNFANIGRQTTLVTVIAVGMTFVIIAAEIDLSVASILKLSGVCAALFMTHFSDNWVLGALVGLLTGAVIGLVNGVLTTRLRIPSFLVTLGMLGVAKGLAFVFTDTAPVLMDNQTFFNVFYEGSIIGIPMPIVWSILVLIAGGVLLHFTTFGRKVFATGGNAMAARYSGIDTARIKMICFVLTGVLAALAALIFAAQGHASRPDFADGLELDVIAAVILGGTSLFGGRGTIIGTLIGSLIIGVLNNGLVIIGVNSSWQIAVKGAIIILAVAFSKRN
jgi:ribose/xylose/arabinose/galactoside ABC-type transport system permease subunit